MEQSNKFVQTSDGRLQFIGEKLLDFVDVKSRDPFAFPASKLKENDMVFLFFRDVTTLTKKVTGLLKKLRIEELPEEGWLFACAVCQSAISPIYFSGQELPEFICDTVYCNQHVRAEIEKNALRVAIDQQAVELSLDVCPDQCMICNQRGIKYFYSSGQGESRESIEDLLSGREYRGFYKKSILNNAGILVNKIFCEDFLSLLKESGGGPSVVKLRNEYLSVTRTETQQGPDRVITYQILSKAALLSQIEKDSAEYLRIDSAEHKNSDISPYSLDIDFSGNDEKVQRVKYLVQKSCRTNAAIFLGGESGTGKTFLAEGIHNNSLRKDKPFIHVNCAAISYNLMESELFGYEAGSFTGASKGGKKGYFEAADGGTLFLDEIGEIPYSLQGKLLEALQSKCYYRVGGTEKVKVDVRLITATNKDLKKEISEHRFREDLFYRINVFPIVLPPLRERMDSLHYIISDLLPGICSDFGIEPLLVSEQALNKMMAYGWPGNIRELDNILKKAALLCDGKIIRPDDVILPESGGNVSAGVSLKERCAAFEKSIIGETLKKTGGDRRKTADMLRVSKTGLFEKIKKYDLDNWEDNEDDASGDDK